MLQGIQLGYTTVSDLGDEVTIPTGALRGLIANMAVEVAPDYNGIVSAGLAKAARDGFNTMRAGRSKHGQDQVSLHTAYWFRQ